MAIVSPLGTPLADGDALHREVEKALLAFPEVVSTRRRTGCAAKDEHVQGFNASERAPRSRRPSTDPRRPGDPDSPSGMPSV